MQFQISLTFLVLAISVLLVVWMNSDWFVKTHNWFTDIFIVRGFQFLVIGTIVTFLWELWVIN